MLVHASHSPPAARHQASPAAAGAPGPPDLEAARSGFEQLGCPGWAQVAAAEADRVSGRRAAPGGGLTLGERRVAELVAGGLSNKQVAERLYVSVATVDTHLRGVYAKLGVRSRTQLARRLGGPG
jgi:DNA-binding CsgD family transcriptional regulator